MRGGYRQNAGRKQGVSSKNAEEARRVLSEMVMRELKPIGKALINKAKKGEVAAIRELFDRAFGKSPQSMTLDSTERIEGVNITFDRSFKDKEEQASAAIKSYLNISKEATERFNEKSQIA